MKKLALIGMCLVLVLALSIVVFACGGEETTTTAAPETTATTAAPTTAPPMTETTAAPSSDTTGMSTETTEASTTMDTTPIDGVEPIELTMVGFLPNVPPGANWHNDFIKKVEDYSKGQMIIKFSGPEAVPAMDAPAAVQRGTVDIGSILSSFADSIVAGSGAIGRAEYSPMELRAKANEDGAFKYYSDEFAKKGIKYLGASVSSLPQVQTVLYLGKEISGLADLKGMKIASTGASNKAWIDSLGATTVPIDFTEYFTAMERGTVDGYNVGIPGILDFSLTPVTKAMLNEPVSSCGGMMLMNLEKWDSLTPKQQEVITKAMVNTEIDGAKMFTSTVEDVISTISAEGVKVITLSPEEAKTLYLDYRDNMWAEDIARWPDIGPKLKEWLVDPNFPRAN